MFDKGLGIVYILVYGALFVLSLAVTITTNIGIWGVAGMAGCGWLIWLQVRSLREAK